MFAKPFPAGLVVIVMVLVPRIPLPLGPVTVIVTLICAFGNECVILGIRVKDVPCETVAGAALMLTELVRPTDAVSFTPVANREPFALRATATATTSIVITMTDTRIHLPSLPCPGPTTPLISLVTLGA
jgi:hypothetical protein